jgi:hypothetical protein
MNYSKCFISIFILFILFDGCKNNPTNSEQPKTEMEYGTYDIAAYMPLSMGNRWIYDHRTIGEIAVIDRRIKDSLRISTPLLMFSYGEDVLVTPPATTLPTAGYYGHRGGTIYVTDVRGPQLCPLFPLLTSPIVVNHTWWTDAWSQRDTFRIVSVSSGSFNNQNIDTVVAVQRWHASFVDTTWFARTVGIIKEVSYSSDVLTVTRKLNSVSLTP